MPALAAAHQLFHHVALLVALHGEDTLVAAAVAVLGDGPFEGGVEAFQSVFEDVVEANEQRQVEVAALEPLHQIHQIKTAAALSAGLHTHVAAKIDGEVRGPPTLEAIQLGTVLNAPSLRRSGSHGVRLTAQGVGVGEHHAVRSVENVSANLRSVNAWSRNQLRGCVLAKGEAEHGAWPGYQ